jgi:quercetin dioxygenase-like cupin family protein
MAKSWCVIIGAVAVVFVLGARSGRALATPQDGVAATDLGRATVTDFTVGIDVEGPSDIVVAENVFAPGGSSGWHSHPGPVFVLIRSGALTLYDGHDPNCRGQTYTAGEGFVMPGPGHAMMVRNESTTTAAEVHAVYLGVPVAGSRRVDEAKPGHCAF